MAANGIERLVEFNKALEEYDVLLDSMPLEGVRFLKGLVRYMIDGQQRVIDHFNEGNPIAGGFGIVTPEIFETMGIPAIGIVTTQMLAMFMGKVDVIQDDLEGAERMGVSTDLCSVLRAAPYLAAAKLLPKPTVIATFAHACDSVATAFEMLRADDAWGKVPTFALDGPWIIDDDGLDYYAGEIRRLVSFLKEHTGRKMDMDRLREVVEESNKQVELWGEWQDLRRAVPCPQPSILLAAPYVMAQNFGAGRPEATVWFRDLVADAEEHVKAQSGPLEKEKIRVVWGDLQGVWTMELYMRLEQEWGAIVTMDMLGGCPFSPIDITSEESIYRGLAQRMWCSVPMAGQMNGPVDRWLAHLVQITRDHKADCVLMPIHVGHKEVPAVASIIRERFRELGVPISMFDCDLFDPRESSADSVMEKIAEFFSTMELG